MSDRWVLAAAAAAWSGAWTAVPLPLPAALAAGLVVVLVRHPASAAGALFVLCSALGARALAGLDPPPEARFDATITLATDPELTFEDHLRFEARTSQGRLLAEVRGPEAVAAIGALLAGERATVVGETSPFTRDTAWTRSRHLAGRLRIESVSAVGRAAPPAEAANRFRRLLDRGATSLSERHRSLLAGLVLGDDRAQPPELSADFRAAGLTHLLAVSGQNVVFVLVVFGPLLRLLRLWPRFLLALAVVAAFALLTRFEPSVVRATFVAGVALFAHTTGRPSGGVRHLSIAICLLLVIDPLLVHSLGFRLSVAASAGVLLLAPPIVARLRGPTWFRDGLGITAGAQLAVAPVLVPVFGPMPLAALPANVLAGPVAGLLMVWGLTGGVVAAAVGGRIGWLLHRPSAVGLHVLEAVAAGGASLPLGQVGLRHLALLAIAGALVWWGGRRHVTWTGPTGLALAALAVVAPILTPVPLGPRDAGYGATVWVDGRVAVVDVGPGASPVDVLDALREAQVSAVGLVVVRTSRSSAGELIDAVQRRFAVGAVVGPPGLAHPDVVVPERPLRIAVGRLSIAVDDAGPPLRLRIGWAPPGDAEAARTLPAGSGPAVGSAGALGARSPPLRRDAPPRRARAGRGVDPGHGSGRLGGAVCA